MQNTIFEEEKLRDEEISPNCVLKNIIKMIDAF